MEGPRAACPDAPADYFEFLARVGAGQTGAGRFTRYNGRADPREILGEAPSELRHVTVFGDDVSGFCAGFRTLIPGVVEIDPSTPIPDPAADSFEAFIRSKISIRREPPRGWEQTPGALDRVTARTGRPAGKA